MDGWVYLYEACRGLHVLIVEVGQGGEQETRDVWGPCCS
jgi:hypothetical protein